MSCEWIKKKPHVAACRKIPAFVSLESCLSARQCIGTGVQLNDRRDGRLTLVEIKNYSACFLVKEEINMPVL